MGTRFTALMSLDCILLKENFKVKIWFNKNQEMSGDSVVVADIKQLKILSDEIKKLSKRLHEMRQAKKNIEVRVISYFEKTQKTGAKTSDMLVLTKQKFQTARKPEEEKREEVFNLLAGAGIQNVHEMYDRLTSAMKGEQKVQTAVVLKENNKKKK